MRDGINGSLGRRVGSYGFFSGCSGRGRLVSGRGDLFWPAVTDEQQTFSITYGWGWLVQVWSGLRPPTNSKFFPFRRDVVSLCRPGPAWRTPTNSKLFPFRMAVVSLCRLGPAWRTPTNSKFFPFRMAVVSLCRPRATRRTPTNSKFYSFRMAVVSLCHPRAPQGTPTIHKLFPSRRAIQQKSFL